MALQQKKLNPFNWPIVLLGCTLRNMSRILNLISNPVFEILNLFMFRGC
jgi:hypothetical protein